MIKFRAVLVGFCLAVAMGACGGGGGKTPAPGAACVVNSECNNPLSCSFGRCHAACVETRDCPSGLRCVVYDKDKMINVCQLPDDENTCKYNTDCDSPLVCARDLRCRAQCRSDRDCAKNQKCVSPDNVCADPDELDSTMMLKNSIDGSVPPPPPDGGAGSDGPMGGGDGASPDGGGMTDAPMSTGDTRPNVEIPVEGIVAMPASIRQGGSGTIVITGQNLGTAADFKLDDITVRPEMVTDTMVRVAVEVQHGAVLGNKSFSFTTVNGRAGKADLVKITAITSGPTGNDTMNRGTDDSPFRTLKRALQLATTGDTVQLLDGTYRMSDGETWMVDIPANVTVQGQTAAGTQLIGPGETGASTSLDALNFVGDATVKNLTALSFRRGVNVEKPGNTVTLDNVRATNSQYGIYINYQATGAKVRLSGTESDYSKNQYAGMYLYAPMSEVTGTGAGPIGTLAGGYAIQVSGMAVNVSLNGFTLSAGMSNQQALTSSSAGATLKFEKTTFNGRVAVSGMMSSLEIIDSTVNAPMTNAGIDFSGKRLRVTGTTITGGYYGIQQSTADSEATIRGTTIMGYTYYGYHLQTGKLDLGTGTESGNNKFIGPDTANTYGLYDARQPATVEVTCSGTSFNDFRPPPGLVMGPANEAGKYRIYATGNVVHFF